MFSMEYICKKLKELLKDVIYPRVNPAGGFPGGSVVKNLSANAEDGQVRSLGPKDSLEEEMDTHSSILAWEIPWTEEPGGIQSVGLRRVRHDLSSKE